MKGKYKYLGVIVIILIFGVISIRAIIDRYQKDTLVQKDRLSKEVVGYVTYYGEKRKVPEFAFINQDSLLITDQDYLGKVYLVEFFFTSCPTICPLMTNNLIDIQNEFKDESDFGIASFTITPKYDTPQVLKEYAEKHEITALDWHFLTGDRDTIYNLASSFNILAEENPEAPGGFQHDGLFALIDKKGFIRSRKDDSGNPIIYYRGITSEEEGFDEEGLEQQITALKEDIKKLLDE